MNLDLLLAQHQASPELSAAIQALFQSSQEELASALQESHQTVEQLKAAALRDQFTIERLSFELARLNRIRFARTSETLKGTQLDLFAHELDEEIGELAAALSQADHDQASQIPKKPRTQRAKSGHQPIPDGLPRIIIRHELSDCSCGQCGNPLVQIGEDVTEKLRVIPARFEVEQHVRPKYACRQCESIKAAPVPASVIEGGLATPSVLSWVVVSKYQDHLPLYRIAQIAEREGVPLAQSTLGEWVGKTGFELTPLYDRLKERLLAGSVVHADETPLRQLNPGQGKTKKAYLWAYRNNDLDEGPPLVLFDYQTSRGGEHARNFLGRWRGFLCVDDYVGYKALFRSDHPGDVACIEVGCLAHARRKFFDLHAANQSPMAAEVLARIGALYAIEAEGRTMSPSDRQRLRGEKALPILTDLKQFLVDTTMKVAPNGAASKAITYTLRRWESLERYASTGHLPIDNNAIERDIRPIAVGKKNWLHVGSERAGKRAAIIQSLLGTARLNGIHPTEWLESVLEVLPTWKYSRLDELLPLQGWSSAITRPPMEGD